MAPYYVGVGKLLADVFHGYAHELLLEHLTFLIPDAYVVVGRLYVEQVLLGYGQLQHSSRVAYRDKAARLESDVLSHEFPKLQFVVLVREIENTDDVGDEKYADGVLDGIDVNLHRVVRGKVQVSLDNESEDRKCSREQQQLDKDPAGIFEHSDAVVGLA